MAIDETRLSRAHAASVSASVALSLGKVAHGYELSERERAELSDLAARLGGYSSRTNPQWLEELARVLGMPGEEAQDDRVLSVLFSLSQGEPFDAPVLEPVWEIFRLATKALLSEFGGSGERPVKLVL